MNKEIQLTKQKDAQNQRKSIVGNDSIAEIQTVNQFLEKENTGIIENQIQGKLIDAKNQKNSKINNNQQQQNNFDKNGELFQELNIVWKIIFFIPILILGILQQYAIFLINVNDIILLMILNKNQSSQNIPAILFMILVVIIQKVLLVKYIFDLCQIVIKSIGTQRQVDAAILDYYLIKMQYINVSNILYERITSRKIPLKTLNIVAIQTTLETLFYMIIRIFAIYTLQIQEECKVNIFDMQIAMVFSTIYYLRFMIYYFKRKGLTMPMNDNLVIAASHLNEFVSADNQFNLVINNQNQYLIQQHLPNFFKLSKLGKSEQNAKVSSSSQTEKISHNVRNLEGIFFKFTCNVQHKQNKEEVFRLILLNSKIIDQNTRIQEIKLYDTVLSNQDIYYIGLIIEQIPSVQNLCIDQCIIMIDHLFNKNLYIQQRKEVLQKYQEKHFKNLNQGQINFSQVSFEEEIILYIKIGIIGRINKMDKSRDKKSKNQFDMNIILSNSDDKEQYFGKSICSYYQNIQINKKRMYDEIDKMLSELDFISIHFRFAAPTNHLKVWFNENNNFYEIIRSQIPYQSQHSSSFKEILSELKIPQNKQSQLKYRTLQPYQSNGQPFIRVSQQVYGDQEQQIILKNFMDKKNQIFFTQKKIQSIFCNQFQNINFYSMNLIDIPDVFLLLQERMPEEIQSLKKSQLKQNLYQFDESLNPQRYIINEEKEEIVWLFANQLKQARKIESIRFRVAQYKIEEEQEQEYLQYFALEKRFAFVVLKILDAKSFNCQIKNLEISGEYGVQSLLAQTSQKNVVKRSSEQFEDLQISDLLYKVCFKFQSLQQISLTSIKINKLNKYLEMCLNQNPNLSDVQFTNCSSQQLSIDNDFFKMSSKLTALNSLCLNENNAFIKDIESMFQLFMIILLIENVDLSNNPLFLNEFIIIDQDFDQQIQTLISKLQIDLYTISANGENLEQQIYPLQKLNLNNTLLGQYSINQINFLNILTLCLTDRKNQIIKIDLSQNYIESIQHNGADFKRIDASASQSKNVFQVIKEGSVSSSLEINLSKNYLTVGDLFTLLQTSQIQRQKENQLDILELSLHVVQRSLKLQIDFCFNFIDITQINEFCIKMVESISKYEIFTYFLIKEIMQQQQQNGLKFIQFPSQMKPDTFSKKNQVSKQFSFFKDKIDEKNQIYNIEYQRQKIDQIKQFLNRIILQVYNESQDQKHILCDIKSTMGVLQQHSDFWTFLKDNKDKQQMDNFLKKKKSQNESEKTIHKIWNQICNQKDYKIDLSSLQGIDLSDQNLKTQNEFLYSQKYKQNISTHYCIIKVFKLLQTIIDITSQLQKQQQNIFPEQAKYLLKIINHLQQIYTEYSVYQRQYEYKLKFDLVVLGCPLIILKLQNIKSGLFFKENLDQSIQSRKTQDIILKVIMQFLRIADNQDQKQKYYQKEVQKLDQAQQDYKTSQTQICLEELDFSRNILSPEIIKNLSLLCQKSKSIKKLVLDETQISLSSIIYLFMAFTDEKNTYEIQNQINNSNNDFELQNLINKKSLEFELSQEYELEQYMENPHLTLEYQKKLNQARNLKEKLQRNLQINQKNQNELQQSMLELLSLKGNKINSGMMHRINYKLQKGLRIQKLDLSDNLLGDSGVKQLCKFLGDNQHISKILLKNNQISERGALRLLKFFDGSFKNIKSISIAGNLKMKKIVEVCEKRAQLFNIKDYENEGLIYI